MNLISCFSKFLVSLCLFSIQRDCGIVAVKIEKIKSYILGIKNVNHVSCRCRVRQNYKSQSLSGIWIQIQTRDFRNRHRNSGRDPGRDSPVELRQFLFQFPSPFFPGLCNVHMYLYLAMYLHFQLFWVEIFFAKLLYFNTP